MQNRLDITPATTDGFGQIDAALHLSDEGAGYTVLETIHSSSRAVIYRAARREDGQPVTLKVLSAQYSSQQLDRLKNELDIGGLLDLAAIVRPIAREIYQGRPALVLEDFDGQSLARQMGTPLEVGTFLRLALAIAEAVAEVHEHNVVHKDLKPDNLLVHPVTGVVKIADFGIAASLPAQRQSASGVRLIEGSLPYMSPEQTGRTNRALDQRSDLYSLGVTFFEMLTGRLPFQANDPLDWVHCHVARRPPSPRERVVELPAVVAAIVMKLLAKEPEDRYQSARGLQHDLARCLEAWTADHAIDDFPLGGQDVGDRFQIQQRLHGREREVGQLREAYQRVVGSGAPELVLVSGYSGIGKSSLVQELQGPIVRARGLFAGGKFDQYQRDIPYSTIVEAMRELVLEILARSEAQIEAWRVELRAALGPSAQLIVDVIPQLELVIGPQPPVTALPAAEARNRFRLTFRRLIDVFAREEHPLALFFDDLQWADAASLEVLSDLVTRPAPCHLLLIGAYRDNEIGPQHPLTAFLLGARESGAKISPIALGPLSREQLGAFVSDVLHCPAVLAAPLADLVEEKTAGNPFFALQFLATLHDEHLVRFDGTARAWRWDLPQIRAQSFTDNVADLMVSKLRRLSPAAQEALQRLACLGTSIDLGTAATILQGLNDDALGEATRAGLLVRLGDSYRFLHDRVQEAAYSLVPEAARPAAHLRIGRQLLASIPAEALAERVFDVVNQLNQGAAEISDPLEKETLRRLNLLAGDRAKAAIAFGSARSHFMRAAALWPQSGWSSHYEETFRLHLALAECEDLVGNLPAANQHFDELLAHAHSNPDRARVYSLRIRLYQNAGRYAEGLVLAQEAFRLFDVTCPETEAEIHAAFTAEAGAIATNLRGRRIADLFDAPLVDDPEVRATIALLIDYLPCAYNTGSRTFPLIIAKVLNLCLRLGNVEEACFAYSTWALVLVSFFGDIPSAFAFSELSLRLNEKFGDTKLRGTLLFIHGAFANFWRRPFSTSGALLDRSLAACLEVGDFVYAGYAGAHAGWHAIEAGDPLNAVLEVSHRYAEVYRQVHSDINVQLLRLYDQFVACLKGKTRGPGSFEDDTFDEARCLALFQKAGALSGFFIHHLLKTIANFVYERNAEALESATQAEALLGANIGSALEPTQHLFHALALAASHDQADVETKAAIVKTLQEKLPRFALWAEHCPANFRSRQALVQAELARIEGRDLEAMRAYQSAIDAAAESGLVHQQALSNELAARFYRARGFAGIALHHLAEARACYARWGAEGKVRQLDRLHPHLRGQPASAPSTTFSARTEHMDLLSVVKASQAISGEIVLDGLLSRLLEVVIAQAGAEKGYLVLRRGDSLVLEAEAHVEPGGTVAATLLRSAPLADALALPLSIIQYVSRTRDTVLLENAADGSRFAADEYVARTGARSILCLPIVRQAELVGVLSLENGLVTGAFREDDVSVLQLLAAQAAISLDHALALSHEQAARAQALDSLRLREEFLTVASHELRTPMTSLTWTLQSLQKQSEETAGALPDNLNRLVDLSCRQVRRMNRLIGELLEVSRIQSGRLTLELGELDLVALVSDALKRFEPDFTRARCTAALYGDAHAVGTWDRARLDRVVENLLSNAIKFAGGGPIEVTVAQHAGVARVSVQDRGIGIDPSQQAHIFERFGRAVSEEHYGGLGLGLYICRRIVETHGGTIAVQSALGAGTCFTVELPLAGPPPSDAEPAV